MINNQEFNRIVELLAIWGAIQLADPDNVKGFLIHYNSVYGGDEMGENLVMQLSKETLDRSKELASLIKKLLPIQPLHYN